MTPYIGDHFPEPVADAIRAQIVEQVEAELDPLRELISTLRWRFWGIMAVLVVGLPLVYGFADYSAQHEANHSTCLAANGNRLTVSRLIDAATTPERGAPPGELARARVFRGRLRATLPPELRC